MSVQVLLVAYCVLIVLASVAGGRLSSLLRMTHLRTQLLMSFVGGLMLGIATLHLLPHAAATLGSSGRTGVGALVGIVAMFLLMRAFHPHQHGAKMPTPVGTTVSESEPRTLCEEQSDDWTMARAASPDAPPHSPAGPEPHSDAHVSGSDAHGRVTNAPRQFPVSAGDSGAATRTRPRGQVATMEADSVIGLQREQDEPLAPEQVRGPSHEHAHSHDHSHSHEHSHGHSHEHSQDRKQTRPGLGWIGLVFGLGLHTLIDGVALSASVLSDAEHGAWLGLAGLGTFLAVALHKPLDAFAITSTMRAGGWARGHRDLINLLFATACPLGAALFYLGVTRVEGSEVVLGWGLALSAGFFLCIALADLLPEVSFHDHDRGKLTAALLLGIALAVAVENLPGHHHGDHHEHGHDTHGHSHHSQGAGHQH